MRFLVDESTGPRVASWLQSIDHDVYSVYDEMQGVSDDEVMHKALADNRILITNDKDFGEMVYQQNFEHVGIILLRFLMNAAAIRLPF